MIWLYSLSGVLLVSLVSLIGAVTLMVRKYNIDHLLLYLVSFSVGALFGDVFIHIIPEVTEKAGFDAKIGVFFLSGIVLFFIVEKIVHWHHCHRTNHSGEHLHPMVYTNLIGDGMHNFLDGVIIASAFLVSVPIGVATTLAVLFHEIPQEIGDFGVLLYSGLTKSKALLFNLLSGLLAVFGVIFTLILADQIAGLDIILLCVAGGGFIYIAGSDLIPELHKGQCAGCRASYQLIAVILGIGVMASMLFLE